MSQYVSKYAKCPYYRRHDTNRICCEGTSDDNTINIVFGSKQDLKEYERAYCNDIFGCRDCPLHKMLDKKYED